MFLRNDKNKISSAAAINTVVLFLYSVLSINAIGTFLSQSENNG